MVSKPCVSVICQAALSLTTRLESESSAKTPSTTPMISSPSCVTSRPSGGCLGFVKLHLNDPNAFSAVAKRLSRKYWQVCVTATTTKWSAPWNRYRDHDYYFRGSPNITFWLAHLYACLGLFERALSFYDLTIKRQGVDEMLPFARQLLAGDGQRRAGPQSLSPGTAASPDMPEALQALQSLPT